MGPNCPFNVEKLVIKTIAQIGGGAQGDVFTCEIEGVEGIFVNKVRKIKNNPELADKTLKDMVTEYEIAKDLNHSNIVKYLAFMRKYDPNTKKHECHIIIE